MRTKRDKFLDTRFKILKPFLLPKVFVITITTIFYLLFGFKVLIFPTIYLKNYFTKKTTKEVKESRKLLESKEMYGESVITDNITISNLDVNIVDIEQEEPNVAVVAATSTIDIEQNLYTDESKGEYVDATTAQDINIINDIIDIETSNIVDNIESGCESKEMDNIEEVKDDEIEKEEEEDEVQETSLCASAYFTMNGVKILNQPSILKAELHEHQIQGISWMVHMFQNGMPMILGSVFDINYLYVN